MSKLLRLLLRAGEAMHNPMETRPYVRPRRGDAARDLVHLTGDMRKVGSDLRRIAQKELSQHGR